MAKNPNEQTQQEEGGEQQESAEAKREEMIREIVRDVNIVDEFQKRPSAERKSDDARLMREARARLADRLGDNPRMLEKIRAIIAATRASRESKQEQDQQTQGATPSVEHAPVSHDITTVHELWETFSKTPWPKEIDTKIHDSIARKIVAGEKKLDAAIQKRDSKAAGEQYAFLLDAIWEQTADLPLDDFQKVQEFFQPFLRQLDRLVKSLSEVGRGVNEIKESAAFQKHHPRFKERLSRGGRELKDAEDFIPKLLGHIQKEKNGTVPPGAYADFEKELFQELDRHRARNEKIVQMQKDARAVQRQRRAS